jgi:hypothetical protein
VRQPSGVAGGLTKFDVSGGPLGVWGRRAVRSPSPRPSPLRRGSALGRALARRSRSARRQPGGNFPSFQGRWYLHRFPLSPRGTSRERAGERGISIKRASSPRPSPPSCVRRRGRNARQSGISRLGQIPMPQGRGPGGEGRELWRGGAAQALPKGLGGFEPLTTSSLQLC